MSGMFARVIGTTYVRRRLRQVGRHPEVDDRPSLLLRSRSSIRLYTLSLAAARPHLSCPASSLGAHERLVLGAVGACTRTSASAVTGGSDGGGGQHSEGAAGPHQAQPGRENLREAQGRAGASWQAAREAAAFAKRPTASAAACCLPPAAADRRRRRWSVAVATCRIEGPTLPPISFTPCSLAGLPAAGPPVDH